MPLRAGLPNIAVRPGTLSAIILPSNRSMDMKRKRQEVELTDEEHDDPKAKKKSKLQDAEEEGACASTERTSFVLPDDFHARIPGFASEDGQLQGVETRTSSPVRLSRDPETLESPGVAGLYPCGEGAGYAGGIVSAALDGRRVALALLRTRADGD